MTAVADEIDVVVAGLGEAQYLRTIPGMGWASVAGLREVLYLPTISCLQHTPRIRTHDDRLIQRADRPLPKMQALKAWMNKRLVYAFAVMSRREAFQLDHDWQRTMSHVA
jgi:hypothetical protein